MKIREGFVSNSSSSSFIINKCNITDAQLQKIREHSYWGEIYKIPYTNEEWEIKETENTISGYTTMDNFDMDYFLTIIGVFKHVINWSK